MRIYPKLLSIVLAFVIVPMLFVGVLIFSHASNSIESDELASLGAIAELKKDRIEAYFQERFGDIRAVQGYWNIKKNLPVVARHFQQPDSPAYIQAKNELDSQLRVFQQVYPYRDVLLFNARGSIVYASNAIHQQELGSATGDERAAFEQGMKGIYISKLFRGQREQGRIAMLLAAPAHDQAGIFIGVVMLELDVDPIYAMLRNDTGLGQSGESLIVRRDGEEILFLSPLRHDANAALMRRAPLDGDHSWSLKQALQKKSGAGILMDYRGVQVISAWNYISLLDWGVEAKIDVYEAFTPVRELRDIALLVAFIAVLTGMLLAYAAARSLSNPVRKLSEGAAIIGSGNLNYRVGTDGQDEIGDLSRAIDQMTINLKKVTASRDELNLEVAERRAAEVRLEQSLVELKQTNAELQQFAYVASHDLQEPLRMVASYTQLLGRRYAGKLDADADEFIAYAVEGAQRINVLLNDLVEYLWSSQAERHPMALDMEAVLARTLKNMQSTIAQSKAEISHDPLPMVMADAAQITVLLQHLIANAIKFHKTEEPPKIHISSCGLRAAGEDGWRENPEAQDAQRVTISVSDNGIGIDPQYFERIFVIFQRLHGRSEYSGSGIGLAICRKIVERHGGSIWLESESGRGATFYFTLPWKSEEQVARSGLREKLATGLNTQPVSGG